MENKKKIIDWILKNSPLLKIKATKIYWTNKWLIGYFDYRVRVCIKGEEYIGRGTDIDESLAFVKACVEALERFVVSELEKPWGTAGYYNFEGACKKAYFELTGIDRVLCHHFCKRKFKNISWKELNLKLPIKNLIKNLEKHKLILNAYELVSNLDTKIAIVTVWSKDRKARIKGFVDGFGVAEDIEGATKHAIIECLRNALVVFFTKVEIPEEETICHPGNPRWHFWMAQKGESLNYLQNYFIPRSDEKIILKSENISIKDVQFTELTALKSIFPDIPLSFVQAQSDKLLVPQFGEFIEDEHTMKRLEIFNGAPVIVNKTVPHFYG